MSEDDLSSLGSSFFDDDLIDNSWDDEMWQKLIGDAEPIVNWMAELCPANCLLHTFSLDNEPCNHDDRKRMYERDEADLWRRLLAKFPEQHALFKAEQKRYEDEFEESILSDFFLVYREPYMVVGNPDARSALKKVRGLMPADKMYTVARIHRLVFTSNSNMTEITSHILNEPNPSPLLVLDALRDHDRHAAADYSTATFGFNMGCARDLLNHLTASARCTSEMDA